MKAYTNVSRKTVREDRVAICPNFGCEHMRRVKPLKFRFLGFGKYPKCKKHHIPLVYVDERIGDFVDAVLACFFDKAGLPPNDLLEGVKSQFSDEISSFVEGWVYCITVGRGAPIVSHYMDAISNTYLKQLTKKQIRAIKKGGTSKPNLVNKAIKSGMVEIANQYTRILKHLRAHSEVLTDPLKLQALSKNLQNYLKEWQKITLKKNKIVNSPENRQEMALEEIKNNYDQILNIGTCRCLLGLDPEIKEIKKAKLTAFDRFSVYHEFFKTGLTSKFTKPDIFNILDTNFIQTSNQINELGNKNEIIKKKKGRKSIKYDDYLKVVNERDDLMVGISADQFAIIMEKNETLPQEKCLRRSHVKLPWRCKAENHEFFTSYSKIKNIGQKCPECRKIQYKDYVELVNSRPDLVIGMTADQFNNIMKENDMLPRNERQRPSYVKLQWMCKAQGHKWSVPYHTVKAGTECPHCSNTASIIYADYLDLIKKRLDLSVELNEAEFNKIMINNSKLPPNKRQSPSHVHKLRWKCKAEGHRFQASYSKIKNEGKGCPECRKIQYENYSELVKLRPDLVIGMTADQFNKFMEENDMLPREKRLRPSQVQLPWKCKFKNHIWMAPYNRIKKGHGCSFCGEQARVIGLLSHPIIEYYNLKYLIDLKECRVKYEKTISQDRKFRPDLLINRDYNFKINIEQHQNLLFFSDNIGKVLIDFTFGLDIITILNKCYRYYQSENRYLLIVMMRERKDCTVKIVRNLIQETGDIGNREKIRVLNFTEFLEFLGLRKFLDKKLFGKLSGAIKLALDSFESEIEFNKLIKVSRYYSELITRYK